VGRDSILVVDDDREFRETIVDVLAQAGMKASIVENGQQAVEIVERSSFDVVLLDLVMPQTGGMDALSEIKKRWPRTRVIMITGFATVENAVEAIRQGADDYIEKPFKIRDLITRLRKQLEEVKFAQIETGSTDIDAAFAWLSNVIRRNILKLVQSEGKIRFMDIARRLDFDDHTKINFHLKILKETGIIEQDEGKAYVLTRYGGRVAACLRLVTRSLAPFER
jgi:DNA-binding NtrC family response regulator